MGKGGDQLMPSCLAPDLIEQKGPEIERFRVDLFKRKYLPRARAFPGVRELFERLRAEGQSLVLASSAKADELEHYKSLAGITNRIDAATSSDDVERSKPYPGNLPSSPRAHSSNPAGAGRGGSGTRPLTPRQPAAHA